MKPLLSFELVCGKCKQPRGRTHVCRGGRKGRDRLRLNAGFRCSTCRRKVTNPFTHTCTVRSDFAKGKRQADRQRKAAEKRRKAAEAREGRRKRAAEAASRRKAAAKKRQAETKARSKTRGQRASPHNPRNCNEAECTRYPCRLYADGYDDGLAAASEGGERL